MIRKARFAPVLLALVPLWGCASSMMQTVAPLPAPEASRALVTFLRPSSFGGAIQFGIWDGDRFVGVLSANSYIQYLTEPGEHLFLARAENWSYLKADLEGGRSYFVLGRVFPGFWKARVAYDPIGREDDTKDEKLAEWLKDLKPTEVIPAKREEYVTPRLEQVREAMQAFRDGQVGFEVLEREEFRRVP